MTVGPCQSMIRKKPVPDLVRGRNRFSEKIMLHQISERTRELSPKRLRSNARPNGSPSDGGRVDRRVTADLMFGWLCLWSDRFRLFEKKSQGARRDFSRAVPETFAMVDGRRVRAVGTSHPRRSTAPDAGQRRRRLRDTLLPILGAVALATARPRGGTAAMTHAAGRISRSPRRSDGFSAGSRDGQSMVRGIARGAWLGLPAGAVSFRGRDRPARAASGVRASGRSNRG
jgi:hypothetical protein